MSTFIETVSLLQRKDSHWWQEGIRPVSFKLMTLSLFAWKGLWLLHYIHSKCLKA